MTHTDKTTYFQSLTHMVKGNLGAGILAMPASFAHTGLLGALIGLPLLCLVCTYCVHLLVQCSQQVELRRRTKNNNDNSQQQQQLHVNYSDLARNSFKMGPSVFKASSNLLACLVDGALLITQVGVCCVYLVFVVDNMISILATYNIIITKSCAFIALFPITLLLSFIRTLSRLALASMLANLLQAIGLILIVEYLSRDYRQLSASTNFNSIEQHVDVYRPASEMALGFGSIMFAFEGISVVLPIYSRMKNPNRMASSLGIINVSFFIILVMYFIIGCLGYFKYGHQVRDSITLNLPAEPLYDFVRAMFTASILLTYPLQFYVPHEILWNWARNNLFKPQDFGTIQQLDNQNASVKQLNVMLSAKTLQMKYPTEVAEAKLAATSSQLVSQVHKTIDTNTKNATSLNIPIDGDKVNSEPLANNNSACNNSVSDQNSDVTSTRLSISSTNQTDNDDANTSDELVSNDNSSLDQRIPARYEYYCRIALVVLTFTLAFTVPKLNLLMDLIGSFSGAALCLTIPALLHLSSHWFITSGCRKVLMIIIDCSIIATSVFGGCAGSMSSLNSILKTFF